MAEDKKYPSQSKESVKERVRKHRARKKAKEQTEEHTPRIVRIHKRWL